MTRRNLKADRAALLKAAEIMDDSSFYFGSCASIACAEGSGGVNGSIYREYGQVMAPQGKCNGTFWWVFDEEGKSERVLALLLFREFIS